MVAVSGRLQVNTWEDAQHVKHTAVDVVVDEQHFAESKASAESRGVSVDRPIQSQEAPNRPSSTNPVEGFMPNTMEDDDDLPF